MKKMFSSLIFCTLWCCVYCQNATPIAKTVHIDVLTLKEDKLASVLDTILSDDETRTYYCPEKYYAIFILPDSTLQIQAIDYLFTAPKGQTNEYGVVLHKGHSFFVSGAFLDPRLFEPTEEQKQYLFYTDSAYKDKEGKLTFLVSEEDSYAKWILKYTDGLFQVIRHADPSGPK